MLVKDNDLTYFFYDIGTSKNYAVWTNCDFTGSNLKRGYDYTKLTPQDTFDEQDLTIPTDVCIEMDINVSYIEGMNNAIIRFRKNRWTTVNSDFFINELGLNNGVWHHLKFVASSNRITAFVDGTQKAYTSPTDTFNTFMLILSTDILYNIKYKNFVVYETP